MFLFKEKFITVLLPAKTAYIIIILIATLVISVCGEVDSKTIKATTKTTIKTQPNPLNLHSPIS